MSIDASRKSSLENQAISFWEPSERCRHWLLIGTIMLAADLVLGITATVLEFRHWGRGRYFAGHCSRVRRNYSSNIPRHGLSCACARCRSS